MRLAGANPAVSVAGLEELDGKSSYFIRNDPTKWHTRIPNYSKVRYQDVYPGVNLLYYGNQGRLEYDFVVAAGCDPRPIRLAFESVGREPGRVAANAARLRIDGTGDLVVSLDGSEFYLEKPTAYQLTEDNGQTKADGGADIANSGLEQVRQIREAGRVALQQSARALGAPALRLRVDLGQRLDPTKPNHGQLRAFAQVTEQDIADLQALARQVDSRAITSASEAAAHLLVIHGMVQAVKGIDEAMGWTSVLQFRHAAPRWDTEISFRPRRSRGYWRCWRLQLECSTSPSPWRAGRCLPAGTWRRELILERGGPLTKLHLLTILYLGPKERAPITAPPRTSSAGLILY